MYVIFNREIRRFNATILQKLRRPFYSFRNKKEDKLLLLEVTKGILASGKDFVRVIYS